MYRSFPTFLTAGLPRADHSLFRLLAFAVATCTSLSATTINFNTSADYTDNFTPTANGGSLTWNSGGYLDEYDASSTTASLAIYNTAVSGSFTLSLDASFTSNLGSYAGASAGFMTEVNGTGGSSTGYLSVFRLTTTGADFRVFEGATLGGSSTGTVLANPTITGTFSANTYYTFSLNVNNTGGSLIFTGSILNASTGSIIGTFSSITDVTPSNVNASTIGIRLGTINATHTYADNFIITPIPEPATGALIGGTIAAVLVLGYRYRRKKISIEN